MTSLFATFPASLRKNDGRCERGSRFPGTAESLIRSPDFPLRADANGERFRKKSRLRRLLAGNKLLQRVRAIESGRSRVRRDAPVPALLRANQIRLPSEIRQRRSQSENI